MKTRSLLLAALLVVLLLPLAFLFRVGIISLLSSF